MNAHPRDRLTSTTSAACEGASLPAAPREHIPHHTVPTSGVVPGSLRIAIATLIAPNLQNACKHGIGCALLPWCNSARRLRAELVPLFASVDILVLHVPRDAAQPAAASHADPQHVCRLSESTETLDQRDCPGMRFLESTAEMSKAARHHVRRVIRSGVMSYNPEYMQRMHTTLHKWELLRLGNQYDAIFFTDADVDVQPVYAQHSAAQTAHHWATRLPPLVARARHGRLRCVGYPDATSPFLASVFWVLPPQDGGTLYAEGLAVLNAPWNATHGWERHGTPGELFASRSTPIAVYAANQSRSRGGSLSPRPVPLAGKFHAGWDRIDGGDLDQGLYWYMLHYKHDAMAYMSGGTRHRIVHFNQGSKPWRRVLHYPRLPDSKDAGGGVATGAGARWCSEQIAAAAPRVIYESLIRHAYLRAAGLLHMNASSSMSACAEQYHRAAKELVHDETRFSRTACCEALGPKAPSGVMGHQWLSIF